MHDPLDEYLYLAGNNLLDCRRTLLRRPRINEDTPAPVVVNLMGSTGMISMHQAQNLFLTRPATRLNSPRLSRLQPSKRPRVGAPPAPGAARVAGLLGGDPCSKQAFANAKMLQQAFATSCWMECQRGCSRSGKDAAGLWERISQMPPGLNRQLCEAVFGASAIAACRRCRN